MEIVKKGKIKEQIIKCEKCNTIMKYDKNDITTKIITEKESLYYPGLIKDTSVVKCKNTYRFYNCNKIDCPVCKHEIILNKQLIAKKGVTNVEYDK